MADILGLTTLAALLLASWLKLGTRGTDVFRDFWPSYVTYGPLWPNGFRHYHHLEVAGWLGLSSLLLAPAAALAIAVYWLRAERRSMFLPLVPFAVAAMPALFVLTIGGSNNLFFYYAPYCVLLIIYASLFSWYESAWKRLPRGSYLCAFLGLITSVLCYCLLVAIHSIGG